MKKKDDNTVQLFGVNVSSTTKSKVLRKIGSKLKEGSKSTPLWINTPNPEQVIAATDDDTFRSILNSSTISLPDGAGLVLANKILRFAGIEPHLSTKIHSRISGIDLMQDICRLAARGKYRVFLLGGHGQVGELAAQALRQTNPGLLIESWLGAKNIKKETKKELQECLVRIKNFKTDILFVAYGAPWQERWVNNNLKSLGKAGVKIVMVVGGSLDVISGNIPRAPRFMQFLGLEWAWRLSMQPWRLGRQLNLIRFIFAVFKGVITKTG